MRLRTSSWILAVAVVACSVPAVAENVPAGNVLYTVGTTFDSGGRSHAYLLWMPTEENLLRLRSYSIWSKPGAADAAGVYQPESWIEVQTDPVVLEGILRRSERLGQDLDKLEGVIDGLFEIFTPGDGLSRADKLSAILQGAQQDAALYHDLLLLARFYPAVSACIGAAWTGPISGLRTYEVRMAAPGDGPHRPDAARRVVGRVTLDPAAYRPLPAPGVPVEVPYAKELPSGLMTPNRLDPRADRNVRMRWATPAALRERTLLQFGYHVWRVDPQFFDQEEMGMGLGADDLPNYAQAFPEKVKRVSGVPVLIDRMLDALEASDWERDWETYFFIDDNGRFLPGGVPFNDGDEFHYLVTAVDVLGRSGMPSHARRMQICRTVGPNPPRKLTVRDQVTHPTPTTTRQVFGLSWQAPTPVDDAPVTRFDVYRWVESDDPVTVDDPDDPDDWTAPVKVGSVPFQPGVEWYDFEDASLGVPPPQPELNKRWWFTLQAVSQGACFGVPSPHGPPASGVLRDRTAPSGPYGVTVVITTSYPKLTLSSISSDTLLPVADPGYLNLRLRVTRDSEGVDGADFYYRINDDSTGGPREDTPLGPAPVEANYLGSIRFHNAGELESVTDYRIKLPANGPHNVTVHLRGRDVHGNLGGFIVGTVSSDPNERRKEIHVNATHHYRQEPAPAKVTPLRHVSRQVGQDQSGAPLVYFQKMPTGTETWKLYRRIDLGPAVLMKEGSGMPTDPVPADALSANAGDVAYFIQFLDVSGNAGPMIELGHFGISPVEPPPKPMLLPVEALPGQQAKLSWACPPHGVARFHVGVAAVGQLPPDTISADLSGAFELRAGVPIEVGGETVEADFRLYDTGPMLANSSPEHSVILDLEEGVTYSFFVEAVTPSGERSRQSNLVEFGWLMPVDGGPDVPWPARPAPGVNGAFNLALGGSQNGIVIGRLPAGSMVSLQANNSYRIRPPVDLNACLFRETVGEREGARPDRALLPCVVFRYQLPNAGFPEVSGDVVQVTPMLRDIAARVENVFRQDHTVVYDPYFRFQSGNIYLVVPQPMVLEASYRYLLVLFNNDGEIDSVVPTNPFTHIIN